MLDAQAERRLYRVQSAKRRQPWQERPGQGAGRHTRKGRRTGERCAIRGPSRRRAIGIETCAFDVERRERRSGEGEARGPLRLESAVGGAVMVTC